MFSLVVMLRNGEVARTMLPETLSQAVKDFSGRYMTPESPQGFPGGQKGICNVARDLTVIPKAISGPHVYKTCTLCL